MANVIEIVIHATDAATAQIKGVSSALGVMQAKVADLLGVLATPAGIAGAIGATALGLGVLANKLSEQVEELSNLSARTGASINDLRALRQIMVESGQSADALTSALTIANRNLATQADALAKVGITAKTPIEALLQLSDMVTKAGNSSKTTAAAFALLGRGGGELIPILTNLRPSLVDMRDRVGELDLATIGAAKHWDELMDKMGTKAKAVLDEIASGVLKVAAAPMILAEMFASLPGIRNIGAALNGQSVDQWLDDLHRQSAERFKKLEEAGKPPEPKAEVFGPEPDPFAWARQFMELTIRDNVSPRFGKGISQETWAKLVKDWNEALDLSKKLKEGTGAFRLELELLENSVQSMGLAFVDAFDAILFRGKSVADGIREAFLSAIRDIAGELAKIGVGFGLEALAGFIPGPIGKIIAKVGGKFVGRTAAGSSVVNISTLDTRSLRMALTPGGSLARAQDQVRIGSVY